MRYSTNATQLGGHILDSVPFPEAAVAAKCLQTALSTDPSSGEDDNAWHERENARDSSLHGPGEYNPEPEPNIDQYDSDRFPGRPLPIFFFYREEPRMHVHVSHPDGEAKFWLKPEVALAMQTGLAVHVVHVVHEAKQLVEDHLQEIVDAWNKHFAG